uniref:Uncharacterized protein n=1 Tax=Meloidogyne javanica TaxID=6303 RepID=A0A915MRM6_MELJA
MSTPMYNHPDLQKIKTCPYKCLKCPAGGHPDPDEKVPDAILTWEVSDGESDGEREEPNLDPDAFDFGDGFANKAFRKECPQNELGTSDTKQPKEAKVHYQKIPNTDDFSQSITERIGPEFMEQLRAKGLI